MPAMSIAPIAPSSASAPGLRLPVRIGLLLTAVGLGVLLVLTASNRMHAGAVHDPISVNQVRAELVSAGWAVDPGAPDVRHPVLHVAGTRLSVAQGRAVVDVFLFGSTAERVEAEQQLYAWKRTMQRVDGSADDAAARVTSVGNALLVITGDDLQMVSALNGVVAQLAR